MNTMTRRVSEYLHVLISGQRRAESGDGALLHEFVSRRDGDAFAELLRRHGPMVLGLARRTVGDPQIAEDVFQATFLVLSRKAHTLRRPEALAAWLHGVAVRLALRTRKAGARRKQQEARAPAGAGERDPLDELSARELLAVLDEELQRLPESHRWPLILCGLEGLSQEEAARRLGWSAAAIKGRLERGRRSLRRRLADRGLTLPAALAGSVLLGVQAGAVPPALATATRALALTGSGASATVTALAAQGMPVLSTKLLTAGALLAVVGMLGIGMAWWHGNGTPPAEDPEPTAVAQAEPKPANEPLPDGVILRLGTLERRAVGAELALTADGKSIIGVRGGRYVQKWDAANGRLVKRYELGQQEVFARALSPHGRWFAAASYSESAVQVWDVAEGKVRHELSVEAMAKGGGGPGGIPSGVAALTFSPDEQYLAAVVGGERKATLLIWDVQHGKAVLNKPIQAAGWIEWLSYTPDSKRLLIHDFSGLAAYDAATGQQRWRGTRLPQRTWHAITPDGKVLLRNRSIFAFDLATGESVPFDRQPPEEWNGALAVTPDGKTLLVGGPAGVLVWDLAQGKAIRTLAGAGETMVLAADGRSLLTSDGALQRWDLATGKPSYPDSFADGHVDEVTAVRFSTDGKRLVSGSADGTVRLWDTATGKPQHVWRGHVARHLIGDLRMHSGVTALDISADRRQVVSAGIDQRLRVWDTVSGKAVRAIAWPRLGEGATGMHVPALRIGADGTRVVGLVAAEGGTAPIGGQRPDMRPRLATWNLETGAILTSLAIDSHTGAFAAHADLLLGDSAVLDVSTGLPLAALAQTENLQPSRPRAISANGMLVVTGVQRHGTNEGVKFIGPAGGAVWEAQTGKLIARFPTRSWFGSVLFHPDSRYVAVNDLDDIHLVDVTTGKAVAEFRMPEKVRATTTHGSYASCLAFSPDGRYLATGHPDGSILIWEVKLPKRQPQPLGAGEADALCGDLAQADAARAWRAVWRLSEFPDATLPLISKHLQPVLPAPEAVTRPLIADLDSELFDKREAATVGLRKLAIRAVTALEAEVAGNTSVETKRRITALLAEMHKAPPDQTPKTLAQVRAVAALAQMQTPAARALLDALARGVSLAPVTRAARSALGR